MDEETYAALGEAIRHARGDRSQTWLAEEIGVDQTTLSNYERSGRVPLHAIVAIEDACGIHRGSLLIRAGLIAPRHVPYHGPTETAIREDPDLDDRGRAVVLYVYEFVRERSVDGPRQIHARIEREATRGRSPRWRRG